jgi:hypothetical protein
LQLLAAAQQPCYCCISVGRVEVGQVAPQKSPTVCWLLLLLALLVLLLSLLQGKHCQRAAHCTIRSHTLW